ncbi:unnamed protein product, partial [Polarella glacialis]
VRAREAKPKKNSPAASTSATCRRPGCERPAWNGQKGEFCSRSCRDASSVLPASPQMPLEARLNPLAIKDPRPGCEEPSVDLFAFYYSGREEDCDLLCGASFLANFYPLGAEGLKLEAPSNTKQYMFSNAEAAFQALKYWDRAQEFEGLDGQAAFHKKSQLCGKEDWTYAGFGGNWNAMLAALRAKFKRPSRMATALVKTGDAFLLEHNSSLGRDEQWSDGGNGEGRQDQEQGKDDADEDNAEECQNSTGFGEIETREEEECSQLQEPAKPHPAEQDARYPASQAFNEFPRTFRCPLVSKTEIRGKGLSDRLTSRTWMCLVTAGVNIFFEQAPGSNFYFFHCDLVAFYFPGRSAPCDEKCRADFLGNFWDLGSGRLKLTPPGSDPRYFRTAEGAYQALKFWKASEATAFEGLPGEQALKLSRHLSDKGIEMDPHFAGYGTAWQAMRAVLAAKFSKGSDMANALRKTENAFLLEHNSFTGRDDIWSDNCDGSGKNWLGLLLMLRRTELFSYSPSWLRASVDDQTGSFPNREWADKVQEAARRINLELGQVHSDSSSRLGARLRAYSRPRERAASPRAAGMPSDPLKRCDYSITSPPRCAPQSSCPAPLPASFFWYPNLPTRAGTTVIIQPSLHQFSSQ